MNLPFVIAGALALVGAVVHGAVGEAIVVTRLRPTVLSPTQFGGPRMTKLMIRATWHITTLAFVVIGTALAACAPAASSRACEGVGLVAAISYGSFAALTIGLGLAHGPRSFRHPAPLLFVIVALLAGWGSAS